MHEGIRYKSDSDYPKTRIGIPQLSGLGFHPYIRLIRSVTSGCIFVVVSCFAGSPTIVQLEYRKIHTTLHFQNQGSVTKLCRTFSGISILKGGNQNNVNAAKLINQHSRGRGRQRNIQGEGATTRYPGEGGDNEISRGRGATTKNPGGGGRQQNIQGEGGDNEISRGDDNEISRGATTKYPGGQRPTFKAPTKRNPNHT